MSEMTVSAPPVPPPSGTGGVNALDHPGNPTARPVAGAQPNPDSGTESPFAAVLKSRMDKKASNGDTADKPASLPPAAQTDPGNPVIGVDLSGLLPYLGANLAATTGIAAAPPSVAAGGPGEKRLPGLEGAAAASPAPLLAALPAPAPAAAPGAPPKIPLEALDANGGRPNAQARDQASTAADRAKPAVADPVPGKIGPDAAISADGSKGSDKSALAATAADFPALLERAAAIMPGAGAAKAPPPDSSLRIDTPLGQAGWQDEMGQKLSWMLGNGRQQADLVLTPPHLGRVEISLTLNGDQANAIFTSPNPVVREALEGALHRLREVLADAGVSLGQTHVGSESPSQFSGHGKASDGSGLGTNDGGRPAAALSSRGIPAVGRTAIGRGMIDIFA